MQRERDESWEPLGVSEIAAVFRGAAFSWWIAGGHAIEHLVGHRFREHADIDVLVLRKDHAALRHHLADWDCWVSDPPGQLRGWHAGEVLGEEVHGVWCRPARASAWAFQVMLDESDDGDWRSRRCRHVRRPISELEAPGGRGTPFLAPEIQLFYKAESPRPKDALDFDISLPLLTTQQRAWLKQAIELAYGPGNAWSQRLRTP